MQANLQTAEAKVSAFDMEAVLISVAALRMLAASRHGFTNGTVFSQARTQGEYFSTAFSGSSYVAAVAGARPFERYDSPLHVVGGGGYSKHGPIFDSSLNSPRNYRRSRSASFCCHRSGSIPNHSRER